VPVNPSPGRAHDPPWGIWPCSAEEPDNLRATTGTVEVPTERDNDAAVALGARPIQQHEPDELEKNGSGLCPGRQSGWPEISMVGRICGKR